MKIIRIVKNLFHLLEAFLAEIYYGFPSRKIKVIGVTGTDGKTTTTHMLFHILKSSGKKTSMISTIYAEVAGEIYDTGLHTTTPTSWTIQKFLKKAVDAGDEYFVLETTSHALDQNRVWGITYEIGIITNITKEHLDYHGTYENYVKTKAKLLQQSKISLLNKSDESFVIINRSKFSSKIYTYNSPDADFIWDKKLSNKIPGEYNKYNSLAAFAVCTLLGIEEKRIIDALKTFSLPKGRMEIVYDEDFMVIVDFAHTPHAISSALFAVSQEYKKKGRIIHVFGSAGLRDSEKRGNMGRASAEFADISIITEEDHRTEDVEKICDAISTGLIESGFTKVSPEKISDNESMAFCVITNREKAIQKAITIAKKGDVVIVTGKSHEKSLARGKREYPWDEFKAIQKALKNEN